MIRPAENSLNDASARHARRLKLLFFFVPLILFFVLVPFFTCRKPLPVDFSGGVYAKTFQTRNPSLQKHLQFLNQTGFFAPLPEQPLPSGFLAWYSAPETAPLAQGKRIEIPPEYRRKVRLALQNAAMPLKFATPLENPFPGTLGSALHQAFLVSVELDDLSAVHDFLYFQFLFASQMLRSNQSDLFFLENAVNSAEIYRKKYGETSEFLEILQKAKKWQYPFRGLAELDRLTAMRDFEKIRLNGIRLYDGKLPFGTVLKEAFIKFSIPEAFSAADTAVTDFFYDVDRDQVMTLEIFQQILYAGKMPSELPRASRKMSIRCMRRLTAQEKRYQFLMLKFRSGHL